MAQLSGHGLETTLPAGWDGRITVRNNGQPEPFRAETGVGAFAALPRPVMHVASFGLPEERGDFGSGAVELMGAGDVFLMLFEYDPGATQTALFAARGMPHPLAPAGFDTTTLRQGIRGQAGYQAFFQDAGRAFCLYVVLGSSVARAQLVPRVNQVLATVRIEPRVQG